MLKRTYGTSKIVEITVHVTYRNQRSNNPSYMIPINHFKYQNVTHIGARRMLTHLIVLGVVLLFNLIYVYVGEGMSGKIGK